jgi:hypothetical protein
MLFCLGLFAAKAGYLSLFDKTEMGLFALS